MAATSSQRPHVLIIGAGVGGLFLAQFLRKEGMSFELFEKDASASSRGQGFAVGLSMLEEFSQGLPDDVPPLRDACHLLPLKIPSQVIAYACDRRLGVEDTENTPCIRANRLRLCNILSTSLNIHWGKNVIQIKDEGEKVTVYFADGTSAVGDVVVGADGTHSKIREHVLGRSNSETLEPFPRIMIHGKTILSGADMELQLQLGHSAWFTSGPNLHFFVGLTETLADAKSGSYYWFILYEDPTAADANHWARTATREQKYEFALEKIQGLDEKFQKIVKRTGPLGVKETWTILYDAIIEELPVSRVTLLGDAAHPMTPFRGEGGLMSIQDAMALSKLLAEADIRNMPALKAALDIYQKDITKKGSESVKLSRESIERARSGGTPKSWGYYMWPIPETPGVVKLE